MTLVKCETVLFVEDLAVRLGQDGPNLVDGLGFSLEAGQTLCLVGESGCGKSLTALALMGLLQTPPLRVVDGAVRFDGEDLLGMRPERLREIRGGAMAMIFQEPMTSLNPGLRIGEQIAESVRRHKGAGKVEARLRAVEMLKRVRIPAPEKRLDEYPHQLSGGMRQRAMIAMALANDPKLLIADEPTTALDVTIQAQILELMRGLLADAGAAMIMITHDLGVVAEMADLVAVMYCGRIVEAGTVERVFTDPQHPYTIGLMGSLPSHGDRRDRLVAVPGTVPMPSAMPPGCRFATRCPFRLPDCDQVPARRTIGKDHVVACARAPLEQSVETTAAVAPTMLGGEA